MRIPTWGLWMMFLASVVGSWLLFVQLRAEHWGL